MSTYIIVMAMPNIDRYSLYDHLALNEGAYFYLRGDAMINNKAITRLFDEVLDGVMYRKITYIIRKREQIGLEESDCALCSLLIFEYKSRLPWLNFREKDYPNELYEKNFAYLLIVEIKNYVVIIKRNITHLNSFIKTLVPIDGNKLSGVLMSEDTVVQQIKLTSMNMNEGAMRNKSYEANNLKESMPMFGANQNIVSTAKLVNADVTCSLNLKTQRIGKFGNKSDIAHLLHWINDMVEKLENYLHEENFLSHFAMPLSWEKIHEDLIPTALLINVFELQNYIDQKCGNSVYRQSKNGDSTYNDATSLFRRLIRKGIECLPLVKESNQLYTCFGLRDALKVKKLKSGIKLQAGNALSSLYCQMNDSYVSLENIINANGFFSVAFSEYAYIYSSKNLYINASLDKDLCSILSVFEGVSQMRSVVSEKGGPYNEESHVFDGNCIFNIVEQYLFQDADSIVCDDMGNEWADHIAIKGQTISFIHSKYKEGTSLSASNFQEVIGQAVKNIGNLMPDNGDLDRKAVKLNNMISGTGIARCRKGTVQDFIEKFKALLVSPNMKKEVCLAINFISKGELEDAFDRMKKGEIFRQKDIVVQMAWLLNGFISLCKERDLNCRIFCNI